MDLELLFNEYLDNFDGCLVVQAEVDTKENEGTCITDQDLLFLQIHEVTQVEIDEYNESACVEDQIEDIDEPFFLFSIARGYSKYNPQDTVSFRNYHYDDTGLDEYPSFESAFNEIKYVLKDFLEHYDLEEMYYDVTVHTDPKYQDCKGVITNLIEQVKESQK